MSTKLRRTLRRNRVLVVTLLVVGGVVAVLTGISMAQGVWSPILLQDPQPPPPRFGAATTLDEANGEVLIFGGFGTSVGSMASALQSQISVVNRGDTWAYKVATGKWFNRNPIHAPSSRGFAAIAYDGAHKNVVLFGGAPYRTNAVSGETWLWDGKDWNLQSPPEPVPDPRQNAVMVYDAHRKAIVMFGGRGADGKPMNDTWTWDGSAWKIMPSAGAPSPRHSATIAYDVCRAEAVMFGGVGDAINSFAPQPGETWTWDGARWTKKSPLLSPPPRIGASMAYSPASGRVLLYGGFSTTDTGNPTAAVDTDVWRWEGASATGWEKMNSDATTLSFDACNALLLACNIGANFNPPPRGYASFAHLSRDKFNLYGGTSSVDLGAVHSFFNFAPQGALGDHHIFAEQFWINTDSSVVVDTPLTPQVRQPGSDTVRRRPGGRRDWSGSSQGGSP